MSFRTNVRNLNVMNVLEPRFLASSSEMTPKWIRTQSLRERKGEGYICWWPCQWPKNWFYALLWAHGQDFVLARGTHMNTDYWICHRVRRTVCCRILLCPAKLAERPARLAETAKLIPVAVIVLGCLSPELVPHLHPIVPIFDSLLGLSVRGIDGGELRQRNGQAVPFPSDHNDISFSHSSSGAIPRTSTLSLICNGEVDA